MFLMAFTLNIQTSLDGQWELVNVGFAQDSEGSGGSSGGSGGSGGDCEGSVSCEGSVIIVTVCDRSTSITGVILNTPCDKDDPGKKCTFTNVCTS